MLTALLQKCENQLPDVGLYLDQNRRLQFVLQAVAKYSTERPRVLQATSVADGTAIIPIPAAWQPQFSAVRAITIEQQPLDREGYCIAFDESQILLTVDETHMLPAVGANIIVYFTAPHEVTEETTTIPLMHEAAVIAYACYLGALALAGEHIQNVDQQFSGATVNRKSAAQEYRELADMFLAQWQTELANLSQPTATLNQAALQQSGAGVYQSARWVRRDPRLLFH